MPQQRRRVHHTELPPSTRELLRSGLQHAVPFNLHNEIRIREVAPGYGEAELPEAEHLKNHIGTQHGGALFAVAEAAAGAAYIGAFASHLEHIRMNAQEAHITYKRWATGPITARSTLTIDPTELLDTLRNEGHVDLSMSCKLYDTHKKLVAEIIFRFYLKQVRAGGIPNSVSQRTTAQQSRSICRQASS